MTLDVKALPEKEKREAFKEFCATFPGDQKGRDQFCIEWAIPKTWYKLEGKFGLPKEDIVLAFVEKEKTKEKS